MTLFQTIFVPLCGLLAALTLLHSMRGKISRRNGLLWFAVWTIAAVLIAVPSTATQAALRLGIGRGADLVFYLAILAGLGVSLHFYGRYRHLEQMLTDLLRREAIGGARRGDVRNDTDASRQAPESAHIS